jgi:hypothetical protein
MAEEPEYGDRRELFCQLFVPCHTIWYDVERPEQGYRLGRVVCVVTPQEGTWYPLRFPRLFGYAQLHGEAGDYSVRVLLVQIRTDEDGEETQSMLGEYGEFGTFGPWAVEVAGEDFVNECGFPFDDVLLPSAGLFEFQLWRDDDDGEHELLFCVRIWAKEGA